MWMNFGEEMVNMDAVSHIIKRQVNSKIVIEFFRLDGSYMTSLDYKDDDEADRDYDNIKDALKGFTTI